MICLSHLLQITGSCNMTQIMESLRVYTKRGRLTYISEALSLLFTELKERATAQSINPGECLSLLCDVMASIILFPREIIVMNYDNTSPEC